MSNPLTFELFFPIGKELFIFFCLYGGFFLCLSFMEVYILCLRLLWFTLVGFCSA